MCRRHVHKWRMFSFRTGEYPQRTLISISLRPLNSKDSGWSGWPCKVTSGLANIGAFWDTLSTKAIPLEPVKTNGIPRLNHHSLPISALDLKDDWTKQLGNSQAKEHGNSIHPFFFNGLLYTWCSKWSCAPRRCRKSWKRLPGFTMGWCTILSSSRIWDSRSDQHDITVQMRMNAAHNLNIWERPQPFVSCLKSTIELCILMVLLTLLKELHQASPKTFQK